MIIYFFIPSLSMLFWIFPAARQYKTNLFWYFLVYAFSDPIQLIVFTLSKFIYGKLYIFITFLLLLTVLFPFENKKSIRIMTTVILSLVLFAFFSTKIFTTSLTIFIHVIITYFFIRRTFMFAAINGKVNIFHLFLLLEEISIILKLSAMLISLNPGLIYSIATGAFEILIAIFFTLYREDNPKLHIDLRNA
jgi:hypothetical protein